MNNYLISPNNFNVLNDYENTMVYESDSVFNIDEVFEVDSTVGGLNNIENWTLKSIWKREEPKQSPEQIEIEKIQAEMKQLNKRLGELKEKV